MFKLSREWVFSLPALQGLCNFTQTYIYHLQTTKSQLLVEQIYFPSIESSVTKNKNEF